MDGWMPSFMLAPLGEDISPISRNLFCWCHLGMMLIGLMWIGQECLSDGNEPRICLASSSDFK